MTRPRSDERAELAGHLPADAEKELLDHIVQKYPEWEITRDGNKFVAIHRHEEHNPRRERAGIYTAIHEADAEKLGARLFVQRALRGDGAQS